MYAADKAEVKELKLLLAAGADRNATNNAGETALSIVHKKAKLTPGDKLVTELLSGRQAR